MNGILYIVATPIGNLADITLRALETLKSVDMIAAEDTRQTAKLCNRYTITTKLISYHRYTKLHKQTKIITALTEGKTIALVSDGGTPLISDPGKILVSHALEKGIPVVPIPGPTAPAALLSVAGFPIDEYIFYGFLPRRPGRRIRKIKEMLMRGVTCIIFEGPHKMIALLKMIADINPAAQLVVGREMTKIHEEFQRGTAAEVYAYFSEQTIRGEFTILLHAPDA